MKALVILDDLWGVGGIFRLFEEGLFISFREGRYDQRKPLNDHVHVCGRIYADTYLSLTHACNVYNFIYT